MLLTLLRRPGARCRWRLSTPLLHVQRPLLQLDAHRHAAPNAGHKALQRVPNRGLCMVCKGGGAARAGREMQGGEGLMDVCTAGGRVGRRYLDCHTRSPPRAGAWRPRAGQQSWWALQARSGTVGTQRGPSRTARAARAAPHSLLDPVAPRRSTPCSCSSCGGGEWWVVRRCRRQRRRRGASPLVLVHGERMLWLMLSARLVLRRSVAGVPGPALHSPGAASGRAAGRAP